MAEDKDYLEQEEENKEDYENVCFICRRPESKAGKMIDIPGGIHAPASPGVPHYSLRKAPLLRSRACGRRQESACRSNRWNQELLYSSFLYLYSR